MKEKILVADDVDIHRELLCTLMQEEYEVIEASDGRQTLELLEQYGTDIRVVLLDVMMPEMDGFEVVQAMKDRGMLAHIPVLFITGDTSEDIEERGLEMGVSDCIEKPFQPTVIRKRVQNIIELYKSKRNLENQVEEQTRQLEEQNETLKAQAEKLRKSNENVIEILGTVVEYRNLESSEHIKHIKEFTRILAEQVMKDCPEYNLDEEQVNIIATASALHDIGKIAIPDHILLKPGRFTEEEFSFMKFHAIKGADLLDKIKDIWDERYQRASYDICRYHHERYDGRGYPDGLVGEDIPIAAQIVSVIDVYDALVSRRVYKGAIVKDEAFRMIIDGECGVFSPKIIECFKKVRKQLEDMHDSFQKK